MSIWGYWFAACFLGFLALETRALWIGKPTLSRTVWELQAKFPIFAFIFGAVVGGLAIHFLGLIPACKP